MRLRIAAAAARLMSEDGIEDLALAKRKAAKQLGVADTRALPSNDEVEDELRAYQSLYHGDEHRDRIRDLREKALCVMQALAKFRPYLTGAVLRGTAGRYSDIELQLFTDDSKSVELLLLSRNLPYEVIDHRRFGSGDRPVSVLKLDWEGIPVKLLICSERDERGGGSVFGARAERAGIESVAELLRQTMQ